MAKGQYKDPAALEALRVDLQTAVDRCGVLSLSTLPNSALLWAHYAAGHTGVRLRFETGAFSGSLDAISAGGCIPLPVAYKERPPVRPVGQTHREQIELVLLTKTCDWQYQSEWRVLLTDFPAQGQRFRDLSFHPRLLTGVIFGCRMATADREQLAAWNREREPSLELSRYFLHASLSQYRPLPRASSPAHRRA